MRRWLAAVVLLAVVATTPACGVRRRLFGGGSTTRKGVLSVAPPSGPVGTVFTLTATGFRPGEPMTFEIDVPGQPKFVGPRHDAGPDGKVTSTYTPQANNPPGTYKIKAVGSQSTRAEGRVTVVAPPGP